ncbi:unnamed protein product [Arctia plantaginis]|uniref:Protein stoned-B n=1 Tax=Arctia plantaginis TaxID=874455 RepID=A0A8S1A7X7_ARCPL|nr:unnamed protein product [Arctia plantaginis]
MAYNPFLSMTEPSAPVTTEALNPFMITETEPSEFNGDNPFAASNPFSDFGGSYDPPVGDTVPTDIFGGAEPTGAKHFEEFTRDAPDSLDIFTSSSSETERMVKPTELDLVSTRTDHIFLEEEELQGSQPPTRPLPPETQNLILSVTGQMEFTSSHLLDRIPPTRTPSPVSVRDIHSPSPTPEPDSEPERQEEVVTESFDINRNKPVRPPPARPPPASRPPPPRPQPPPPPRPPVAPGATAPVDHSNDINLFDAPVPTSAKPTKEAIMSLYSAPKAVKKQIDFLSDDITDDMCIDASHEISQNFVSEVTTSSPMVINQTEPKSEQITVSSTSPFNATEESTLTTVVAPMDCSEPQTDILPAPSNTSPFADEAKDAFESQPQDTERNPFESAIETESELNVFSNSVTDMFGVKSDDVVMAPTNHLFDDTYVSPSQNVFESDPDKAFGDISMTKIDESHTNIFNKDSKESTEVDAFNVGERNAFDNSVPLTATDAGWGEPGEGLMQDAFAGGQDAFDAFSAKFDATSANNLNSGAWGDDGTGDIAASGFEAEAFDPFLNMGAPPPPAATPRLDHQGSRESTDDTFSVFIRPKDSETSGEETTVPVLAPPPRPQALPESPRVNPFDKNGFEQQPQMEQFSERTETDVGSGGESPPTPLFDDDVSMPLEDFPRVKYTGPGWEMHLRQPNKKKITGQRFWKKIFVRLSYQGDNPVVQLYNAATDKEPFQELPLQACYSVSEIGAQQFDQFGKIFTVKLQYVFYKERPGVRPGQVTKAERITNKLSQFAAYAIQGDYQGVKEFGSDLRKLGLPVEHAPQVSQLFKLGSLSYEDVKQFSCCVEEALFRLVAHRDRALTYKMEEVQITAVDELYVEQDAEGSVIKQIARVRLFFLGFLSGMPDVELGVNDLRRQGKEVVGRHDIIPVVTEEWIRVEISEFHACVQPEEFEKTQIIKFKPPDACYIELMRFRVRPPKNRELPLQLKAVWCVTGNKVELRADVLVPGFASRKLGQVPCEDVCIRFPIPECWIYLFRVEKHFRYGSVKSAHRRTGKIKGIERFLGAVDTLQESLIEVTSGQAKYEHQHRAIVWRMPRLPKEGQGAYTTHNLVCRMALTSYDQIPAELAKNAYVEFTMPATQVSHMTVRSVSLQDHDGDPPEKYVRYLARHEYTVGIERTSGQSAPAYALATSREKPPSAEPSPAPTPAAPQPPSSDSDSD